MCRYEAFSIPVHAFDDKFKWKLLNFYTITTLKCTTGAKETVDEMMTVAKIETNSNCAFWNCYLVFQLLFQLENSNSTQNARLLRPNCVPLGKVTFNLSAQNGSDLEYAYFVPFFWTSTLNFHHFRKLFHFRQ